MSVKKRALSWCSAHILSLILHCTTALADPTDLKGSPIPENLRTLSYRLDNIESSLSNLKYVLNHLEHNVVLFQVIPLSRPHTDFDDVIEYAVQGITASLNFNDEDFSRVLSEVSEFYDDNGYSALQRILQEQDITTDSVKERRIENHAILLDIPVVTKASKLLLDHPNLPDKLRVVYGWHIEVPLLVETFENNTLKHSESKVYQIRVVRSSVEYSPEQMLIDQIKVEDFKVGT